MLSKSKHRTDIYAQWITMIRRVVCLFVFALIVQACHHDEDVQLSFIGDSIVEIWDLQQSFPTYQTENLGRSSSGIEYITYYNGTFEGKNLVVLTGGNDITWLVDIIKTVGVEQTVNQYVDNFITSISQLNPQRVYLYSLLPRGQSEELDVRLDNTYRMMINHALEAEAQMRGWIYIDAYSPFELNGEINPNYTRDGIHPNKLGYDILTQLLKQKL